MDRFFGMKQGWRSLLVLLGMTLLLAACGGSDDSTAPATPVITTQTFGYFRGGRQ